MTDDDLTAHEQNQINESAHKQALYQAWFATGLEQTKSVFTLSSAGVGLSLTLMFEKVNKLGDAWAPRWLLAAMLAFGFSALAAIWVFRINSKIVTYELRSCDLQYVEAEMSRADRSCRWCFVLGLLFLALAAIAHLWLDGDAKIG